MLTKFPGTLIVLGVMNSEEGLSVNAVGDKEVLERTMRP